MISYFNGIIILLITLVLLFIPALSVLFGEGTITKTCNINNIFGDINFVIDPISAFFIIIIVVMGIIGAIYAKGYLKPYILKGKSISSHFMFYTTLILSMLTVVTCQNALFFLLCWEIMSLSSFFLVIFENEKKETLKAGIKYLVFMHISVLFIITAFALVSIKTGSYDFAGFAPVLKNNPGFTNIIFLLFFIGFGIKAGFAGFHNWLPEAHPAAPSHVSAIMSGVMIKTGIYGILRFLSLIGTPTKFIAYFILIISVITALYGVLYAAGQSDFKKMLAYSTIENVGIIGIGLGVGTLGLIYNQPAATFLGFTGCFAHILNHSIFKNLLFFGAGNVYLKTHTKDMETLGGLVKTMPKTAVLFLAGSVAICALPPFNGFISEFLIYFGLLNGFNMGGFFNFIVLIFAFAGLALVGTIAILCFTKAYSIIFLGNPRSNCAKSANTDCDLFMILPMIFLALMALCIGLFPQHAFKMLINPANVLMTNLQTIQILNEPFTILQIISYTTLSMIILIALLAGLKIFLNRKVETHSTWGCGYKKPNNYMQYTGSSYVSPFMSMLKPLFKKVFDVKKPKNLFPSSAHFSLHIEDIEEAYFINPMLKFDEWFLAKFEKLQNGNLQTYLKYGLIFLALALILTTGGNLI